MAKITKKIHGTCEVITSEINGRVTMKCKNLKRKPTVKEANNSAQEIIDSVINRKIILR